MKNKLSKTMTLVGVAALSVILCGCGTITHNVSYDLATNVSKAAARDSMRATPTGASAAVVCSGARADTNIIARVSSFHCVKPDGKEILAKSNPVYQPQVLHYLQAPESLGRYVELAAASAFAAKGIREQKQAANKVTFHLEKLDYDDLREKVVRRGVLEVVVTVMRSDKTVAYQRRISVEASRKRGQASATALIAAVVIAQVSPITLNPDAVREKEEKTATSDVLTDLFSKFQDELVADQDLLFAIRNKPVAAKLKKDPTL